MGINLSREPDYCFRNLSEFSFTGWALLVKIEMPGGRNLTRNGERINRCFLMTFVFWLFMYPCSLISGF